MHQNFRWKIRSCQLHKLLCGAALHSSPEQGDGMLHWRLVNEMDAIDGLIQARKRMGREVQIDVAQILGKSGQFTWNQWPIQPKVDQDTGAVPSW